LLLISCAPIECPQITCPNTQGAAQQAVATSQPKSPPLVIYKLHGGQEPVFFGVRTTFTIYNCGSEAYGPVISDKVDEYYKGGMDLLLVVTKTDTAAIGGCPDIIRNHPELKTVTIYGGAKDTEAYDELIRWIPPNKLITLNGAFELVYATEPVNFNSLTEGKTEIYAPWER